MGRDDQTIPASRWPAWLNAAALLVASFLAIAALSLHVRAGTEIVAVLFPPWWSSQQAFLAAASAEVAVVRMTAVPSLLVVRLDGRNALTRLRSAGAWLAVDPQAISACLGN
jgi:hypothetical protein